MENESGPLSLLKTMLNEQEWKNKRLIKENEFLKNDSKTFDTIEKLRIDNDFESLAEEKKFQTIVGLLN